MNPLSNRPATHRAACANLFAQYAHTIGQAPDSFLANADIDPELVQSDPDARVDDSKIIQLCETLEQKGDNALLGSRIGKQMQIANWGVVGYLMKHAPNLDIAYQYLEKYVLLIAENREVRYWKEDNHAFCVIKNPIHSLQLQITWQTYASANLRMLELISASKVKPVWLAFPKGSILSSKELSNCLGVEVFHGGFEVKISLNLQDVLKPNPSADPYLERIFLNQAQQQLEPLSQSLGLIEKVRKCMALELANGQLSIKNVAQSLGLSERSLQRYLAGNGTTFAQTLEQFRAENAYRLLRNQSLTITQISEILGYQSVSSFHRAFTRWKGMPPPSLSRHATERRSYKVVADNATVWQ